MDVAASPNQEAPCRRLVGAQLLLLEGFELIRDAVRVELPLTAQRLIAFLALHQRPLRRVFVACTLWPDSSEERAAGSLRSALWRLNRPCVELVRADATHLELAQAVEVDIRVLIAAARRLSAGYQVDGGYALADGFECELLPDWYEDWVLLWRERWRHFRLLALESLTAQLSAAGSYAAAVDTGLAAVRAEPLRESAHRAVIQAHLAAGNGYEAVRQHDEYRRLLHRELGLEPSAAMSAVMASLTRR
jgi:DNA-binding SARP family transcriptional activator